MSDVAMDVAAGRAKNAHVWERDPHDWYVEPPAATEALLTVERFIGPVWDPCCGQGNIVETFLAHGSAAGTDIVRRVPDGTPWFAGEFDFMAATPSRPDSGPYLPFPEWHATNIVMNPPFFRAKGAEAFIRKAIDIAPAKVAAFLDVRFLAGHERATGLFAEHPPSRVWIITPRVSCPPGRYLAAGGKAGNGSSDWCWIVWDKTAPITSTQFGWLRRAP